MTEYKKKLKNRLYLAVGYMLIGVVILCGGFILKTDNSFFAPFGAALIVCGAVRLIRYFRIARDEQTIRRQEIKETDERNLEIVSRARNMAFSLYIMLGGTAVIALQFANMQAESKMIAYSVCFFVFLYWICYMIVKRKI